MMRPPASLSQCRGFPSCAASTVASRVFCIDAATADSWTRNVALPPAGTLNELPSGKEYETPGMTEPRVVAQRVRLRRAPVVDDLDRLRLRQCPGHLDGTERHADRAEPSALYATDWLAIAAGTSTRPDPTRPTPYSGPSG